MRLVNADGRSGLLVDDAVFDVETASSGRLPADPMQALTRWDELAELAVVGAFDGGVPVAEVRLGPPVPRPPMIAAVIANFPPATRQNFPMVVGKSPTAIAGPFDDIVLPDAKRLPLKQSFVVSEPELGIIMRGGGRHLAVEESLDAVAGFVAAQDVTERRHEFGAAASPWTWENLPAKTLGKSFDTFCPIGPALVSLDELADPDRLSTRCWINDALRFEKLDRRHVVERGRVGLVAVDLHDTGAGRVVPLRDRGRGRQLADPVSRARRCRPHGDRRNRDDDQHLQCRKLESCGNLTRS